jgi:predicted nucleic acid-binding Zn ribbon protein
MPRGWNHEGCFKHKPCAVCGTKFKPKSGQQKYCSKKCRKIADNKSKRLKTEAQYKEVSGNWSRYLSRLIYSGGKKRQELTIEDLLEILEEQHYKCALTGIPLTCKLEKGKKFKTNVSVDRIEAGGPYIKENIQLVCRAVNSFRNDTSIEEFIWWCKKVVEFNA